MRFLFQLLLGFFIVAHSVQASDYAPIHTLFQQHCFDCHGADDPEGNLVLENFSSLMKGGESGAAIIPGKSAESLLVKMIEGNFEKDGKKITMPPGKKKKLTAEEITIIKAWIDSGAIAPAQIETLAKELVVPQINPSVPPRNPINAVATSAPRKLIAAARYGEIELISSETFTRVRTLSGHRGNVNAVVFSPDGSQLFSASGENALFGEIIQRNISDGSVIHKMEGHRDTIYSAALSSDGKILATGSYDQKIILWDVASGKELKTLSGHNGAVFGLAFRPNGKILASASGDRTVKLWDVATGERLETLTQSLKEVYAVAFSPDGKKLYASGVDSRIRIWEISANALEGSNPILESKFAHEGAVLRLVLSTNGKQLLTSAEDRTIKLWDTTEMKEKLILENQPDWCAGLGFAADGKIIVAGRMDGSLGFYSAADGKILSTNVATAALTPAQSR